MLSNKSSRESICVFESRKRFLSVRIKKTISCLFHAEHEYLTLLMRLILHLMRCDHFFLPKWEGCMRVFYHAVDDDDEHIYIAIFKIYYFILKLWGKNEVNTPRAVVYNQANTSRRDAILDEYQ